MNVFPFSSNVEIMALISQHIEKNLDIQDILQKGLKNDQPLTPWSYIWCAKRQIEWYWENNLLWATYCFTLYTSAKLLFLKVPGPWSLAQCQPQYIPRDLDHGDREINISLLRSKFIYKRHQHQCFCPYSCVYNRPIHKYRLEMFFCCSSSTSEIGLKMWPNTKCSFLNAVKWRLQMRTRTSALSFVDG